MSENHSGKQGAQGMNGERAIAIYEEILGIVDQMLAAAKKSDWDALASLEHTCKQLVNQLMAQDTSALLDAPQQKKKVALIGQILARDAEIRTLTEPHITHLQNILTHNSRKRLLNQTYQPDQE